MSNVLYLDCFAGVAGDMLLGALLDLLGPSHVLEELPARLDLDDVQVHSAPVVRGGLEAQAVSVLAHEDQPHRDWRDIDQMLADADLPPGVKTNARRVFRRLAEAEADVHGMLPEDVHFHEVGAVDAIIDIVGCCVLLHELQAHRVVCSPLPLGRGSVRTAHGVLPLPAPATVALLGDAPVYAHPQDVETVTPTGAALIATLADAFGPLPPMILRRVGYGAGTRINENGPPNVVRAMFGEDVALPETAETTFVIEANIDDMNPEHYEPLTKHLEESGALDVTLIPCVMKRGRPGVLLKVVCTQSALEKNIETIFVHSTTLGLRYHATQRAACERRLETIETSRGQVRIKHAYYRGRLVHSKPEYADLVKLGLSMNEAEALVREELAKK
jgi:hypothetical protein